jgi:hypothetical protein
MASNSKKGFKTSDISDMLESEEFAEKLANSDESELSDTGKHNNSNFHDQEDNVLLPDSGDAADGGENVCVIDINFLWEDIHIYSRQKDIFIGISGPQSSAQGLTNVVGIFELFLDKHVVQRIVDESGYYAQKFRDYRGNILFPRSQWRKSGNL